jgi:hypothetical protein
MRGEKKAVSNDVSPSVVRVVTIKKHNLKKCDISKKVIANDSEIASGLLTIKHLR